jgi:hypothetical protein
MKSALLHSAVMLNVIHCAECRDLFIVMLSVVMLNVITLSVVMLSVVVPTKNRRSMKRNK